MRVVPTSADHDTSLSEERKTAPRDVTSTEAKKEPGPGDSPGRDHNQHGEPTPPSSQSFWTSLLSPLTSLMSPTPPHETRSEAVHEYEDPQAGAKAVNNAGKFAPPQDEKPTHNSQSCNSLECKPHATGETDLSVTEALNKPSEESPEPYYAPAQVPAFKALQKKRLTGTRTKQLLRAAGRAHDDPPPPPELGLCCGSSCDPCVNDLWREELSVWKERWGDRGVEGGASRKELE